MSPQNVNTSDPSAAPSGRAMGARMMNTQGLHYVGNPQKIYLRLKRDVDAVAHYKPRTKTDVDPAKIKSRMIQLAIPETTSPAQWRQLFRAVRYAKSRGVSLVITTLTD